jgi:hypothetical protein
VQKDTISLIIRKLIATLFATTFTAILMAALSVLSKSNSEIEYNLGNQLMSWSFIYIIYVGVIIMIYGNSVSIGLELAQKKWFSRHTWLYILLHGVFGLLLGLLFPYLALFGMYAALGYAGIDVWLSIRVSKHKGIKSFFLIPVLLYGLSWGYYQIISPPMPPFTKEDAVEFATSGEGTVIDDFPDNIGKWYGTIDGHQVERETNAEEIANEIYIVTFTETWKKGEEVSSQFFSYRVERGSLSAHKNGGETPPY